jgi:hypothetical protein
MTPRLRKRMFLLTAVLAGVVGAWLVIRLWPSTRQLAVVATPVEASSETRCEPGAFETALDSPGARSSQAGAKTGKLPSSYPPSLAPSVGGPAVQNDPTRADYNPEKLALIGNSPEDIFEKEPVDAVWAPQMEGRFRALLERNLGSMFKEVGDATIECRTMSCRVTIDVSGDPADALVKRLQEVSLGPTLAFGGKAPGVVHIVMFDQSTRDPVAYDRWQPERQKKRTAYLRGYTANQPR